MIIDEQEEDVGGVIIVEEEEERGLVPHQQSDTQVEITTPQGLVTFLEKIAFSVAFSYKEQAERAAQLIPGMVDKIQTTKIGTGYLLWRIRNLWYEHYRDYLLGAGPRERDGFYHWCIDTLHLNTDYVNELIALFEMWADARKYRVEVIPEQPIASSVQQIVRKKLSDGSRTIENIQDNPRLSDVDKRLKIEEVEKTVKEEVEWLFTNPEHVVIQKKKEEKGKTDRICLSYYNVQYPSDQSEVIGVLSFKPTDEKNVADVIALFHRLLNKEQFRFEVTLKENHLVLQGLDEFSHHLESEAMSDDVIEGIYFDETELLEDEDEEEEDEWDTYEDDEEL